MAIVIEPGAVIESETLDDQRVSVPMSHGVTHPARTGRRFQRTAVEEDLAIGEIGIENQDEPSSLHDLHHLGSSVIRGRGIARSQRHTLYIHVFFAKIFLALLDKGLRPWLNLFR